MKNSQDMIPDLEKALAHHEQEATRLRAMLAAAKGEPVKAQPQAPQPVVYVWPYALNGCNCGGHLGVSPWYCPLHGYRGPISVGSPRCTCSDAWFGITPPPPCPVHGAVVRLWDPADYIPPGITFPYPVTITTGTTIKIPDVLYVGDLPGSTSTIGTTLPTVQTISFNETTAAGGGVGPAACAAYLTN